MLAAPFPSQAMLQGSKSWVPGGMFDDNDDLRFLATAINDRGLLYDFTYGSTASVDTSRRTRVLVKLLENTTRRCVPSAVPWGGGARGCRPRGAGVMDTLRETPLLSPRASRLGSWLV